MTQLRLPSDTRKAIEPDEIKKMKPGEKFLRDEESANPREQSYIINDVMMSELFQNVFFNEAFRARHGIYPRDPAGCPHNKKTMTLGTNFWECSDCGCRL